MRTHLHAAPGAHGQKAALADVQRLRLRGRAAEVGVQRLQLARVPDFDLAIRARRHHVPPGRVRRHRAHGALRIVHRAAPNLAAALLQGLQHTLGPADSGTEQSPTT